MNMQRAESLSTETEEPEIFTVRLLSPNESILISFPGMKPMDSNSEISWELEPFRWDILQDSLHWIDVRSEILSLGQGQFTFCQLQ